MATGLAVAGLAVPLALLGGIGDHGRPPGPAPLGSGTTVATTGPQATTGAGPGTSATELPDVGVFRCTPQGLKTDTPEFAVQADGVHLRVGDEGDSSTLVLRLADGPNVEFPFQMMGSDGVEFVTPFLFPGTYDAACEVSPGVDGPLVTPTTVHVVDPDGRYTPPHLSCADSTEATILATSGVDTRSEVPGLIEVAVEGLRETDVIVAAGYAESDEDVLYLVRRDAEVVAVVRVTSRTERLGEALDVTSCDGSGIGDGQGARRPDPGTPTP